MILTTINRRAIPIGLALALVPLLVSAIAVLVDGPHAAIRDHALMELRVRDVGLHPVLLGLYSRDSWSHPGPLVFFTLAGPYRLFGSSTVGLLVGALAVNGASVAAVTLIARRLGGTRAALVILLAMTVVTRAMGAELMRDPWVLYITVLPFGVFCVLVWAMTADRFWALPVGAGVASWLVQTHVGYAPLTVPMLLAGALWLGLRAIRAPASQGKKPVSRFAGATGLALLVLGVAWTLPLWDQISGSGNLETSARWFAQAKSGVHTIGEGARVVFGQLAVVPDWVTGRRPVAVFNGETLLRTRTLWPVLLVVYVGAVTIAWRRKDRALVGLAAVVGLGLVLAVVAVARTVGIMYEYRLLWIWPLGALAAAVVVWTAWNVGVQRWPDIERILVPVALIALVGLSAAEVADVAGAARADWDSAPTASVVRQLARRFRADAGPVVLRGQSNVGAWFLQGVLLGLEKRGFDARVEADIGGAYGAHRALESGPVQARLLVLGGSDLTNWTRRPGERLLAYAGPVSLARERAYGKRLDARLKRLAAGLVAGTLTQAEFERQYPDVDAGPAAGVAVVEESSS